jgi:hypothetical protein
MIKKIIKKFKYYLYNLKLDELQDLLIISPSLNKRKRKLVILKTIRSGNLLGEILNTLNKNEYDNTRLVKFYILGLNDD